MEKAQHICGHLASFPRKMKMVSLVLKRIFLILIFFSECGNARQKRLVFNSKFCHFILLQGLITLY